LCSDGVWSAVDDHEIAAVVTARAALRVACETLIALANERGGRDNATALIARFEPAASVVG
jgi:serine/threonine protein phosphatase PrpC